MTDSIDVVYVKIILNAILIGFLVFRFVYQRLLKKKRPETVKPGRKYKILTSIFLSLLAAASIFSYTNFGRLHGNGQPVHHWEMFHYYINAKYFNELGYLNLYNAAVVADSEQDNQIGGGALVMDLRTYQQHTKAEVMAQAGAIKSRFSDTRWEQFKSDLAYIKSQDNRLGGMVDDHGFNATPFWTIVGGPLANAVPVADLWLLTLLDDFLMAVMFVFVFWAFGPETALVAIVFFFANFFTSFFFIGGSFLRYDWLATAVIGVCCLKKNKYAAGGSFLAASALLRILPALFAAVLGIKLIIETVRQKRVPARYLKFFGAFFGTVAVLVLLLFTLGNPVDIMTSYAERMALHNGYLLTNNVGLKMLVLADISNLDWGYFISAYQPLDPGKDVFMNWNAWKSAEAKQLLPAFIAIALAAVALTGFIVRRRDDAEAAAFGTLLIFAILAPTNYYFAFLVLLFMVLAHREVNLKNTIEAGALAAAVAASFVVHLVVDSFYLEKFLIVTCLLFACFLAIIGLEISEAMKKKHPGIPVGSGG